MIELHRDPKGCYKKLATTTRRPTAHSNKSYGLATISRLLTNIGLIAEYRSLW